MKNTQKYNFIFAKDEKGEDIKYRFMLSISKSLSDNQGAVIKAIQAFEGIDAVQPIGRYTMDVVIGRAFDPDEVFSELRNLLDSLLSDIIRPTLVTP